jgi:hypothetical protein
MCDGAAACRAEFKDLILFECPFNHVGGHLPFVLLLLPQSEHSAELVNL